MLLRRIGTSVAPCRVGAGLKRAYQQSAGPEQIAKLFDSHKYFANFNQSGFQMFGAPSVGLFRNSRLTSADGLVEFSRASLRDAQRLVKEMLVEAQNTDHGKLSYIRKLDQLSDTLCRVIDVAEFIRVAHPSQRWVDAAQQTHELMFEYMNQLNTNVELYATLAAVLESPVARSLSDEEVQVGHYLRQDFERSGIAMDPATRDNFVAITQEISLLGSAFNNDIQGVESLWVAVPRHEFERIASPHVRAEIQSVQARAPAGAAADVHIPLAGHYPQMVLAQCSAPEVRKRVWLALHNSSPAHIKTLDSFLKYRALLSRMLGYRSFAHYQLEHKMARSPENVAAFLTHIRKSLLADPAGVRRELRSLYRHTPAYKPSASDAEVLASIKPWDRDYLLAQQAASAADAPLEDISPYLSVGSIMSGLDTLFRSIYNVALVPERTLRGETWDQNQVRKLSYVDLATNEVLGYLYVDFWSPKVFPSHFTIVCSRELNTDLGSETSEKMARETHLSADGEYQLPVISLVCNFVDNGSTSAGRFAGDGERPTLLTLEQVDTVFHEMGHATHSMIGRTRLHNLSGTRCSTDFVELPSVLMESFSNDPRVLCRIARHYKTGEYLPESLLAEYRRRAGTLDNTATYMQLKMALLDQALHDDHVVDFSSDEAFEQFSSTRIYHALEKDLRVFADEWSTWHGKFPHLFSYGAVYYSYLLDRAIAAKIWKGLFEKDPWSRAAGEKYRDSILRWGGTRDPWVCLADALDDERLAKGDAHAMALIGEQ